MFTGRSGGGRRRGGGTGPAPPSRQEVLDKARKEREERDHLRRTAGSVLRLQAFARGCLARWRLVEEVQQDVARKLADLGKVGALMAAAKPGTPFVPPLPVVVQLVRAVVVSSPPSGMPTAVLGALPALASYVSASLACGDLRLNASLWWRSASDPPRCPYHLMRRFVRLCLRALATSTPEGTLRPPQALSLCATVDAALNRASSTDAFLMDCHEVLPLARSALMALAAPPSPTAATRSACSHVVDACLRLCVDNMGLVGFVGQVLTVPNLLDAVLPATFAKISSPAWWGAALPAFATAVLPAPGSWFEGVSANFMLPPSSGHWSSTMWLLGNVLGALPPLADLPLGATVATLDVVSAAVESAPVDVFLSATPVVWQATGTMRYPHAMPSGLLKNVAKLADARFVRDCFRVCVDVREANLRNKRLTQPAAKGDPVSAAAAAGAGGSSGAEPVTKSSFRKLWEGAASLFKRKKPAKPAASPGAGALVDTTAVSRDFAAGTRAPTAGAGVADAPRSTAPSADAAPAKAPPKATKTTAFDLPAVHAFARLYTYLVAPARHGADMTRRAASGDAAPLLHAPSILNTLAFSPSLDAVQRLWFCVADTVDLEAFVKTRGFRSECVYDGEYSTLTLLCTVFGHLIIVLDDFELYESQAPIPRRELRHFVVLLKDVLARSCGYQLGYFSGSLSASQSAPKGALWDSFSLRARSLLRTLHDKHIGRPLMDDAAWVVQVGRDAKLTSELLALLPFAVPFEHRAKLFYTARDEARAAQQQGPALRVTIHRSRVFETAFAALNGLGPGLKRRLHVEFISLDGLPEAGIDAGGLFKDLWTSLSAVAFDPSYGFFKVTTQRQLFPNSAAGIVAGTDDVAVFSFLGRVLGKALYEGVVVQPQFASFFLAKLLHKPTHLHDHLPALDPQLYKSLMFIKTCDPADVEHLCLTFSVSTDVLGTAQEIDLIPGGSNIPVTARNRLQYIYLVADLHLNRSIKRQVDAFRAGMSDLIPPAMLAMFSEPELQVLISGTSKGIDVADLKANTSYAGGYASASSTIRKFWSVVDKFSDADKAALLRFVTSCERAPPLGFKELTPPFTIRRVSASAGSLPSASTCFNVLKLPAYGNSKDLEKKLRLAIHEAKDFQMS